MKQPALIDTEHLAETDPEAAALDKAYRQLTTRPPAVVTQQWAIERIEGDEACAARLNALAQSEAAIDSIQLIAPDTYVILWWRYVEAKT